MTWHDYDPGIKEDKVVDSVVILKYRMLAEAQQAIDWSWYDSGVVYTKEDLLKVIKELSTFIKDIPDDLLRNPMYRISNS